MTLQPGFENLPPFEILRKPGQRTLRMRVTADRIMVSVPARTPQAEVDRFIAEHASWMQRKWADVQQRLQAVENANLAHAGSVLLNGVWKPVFGLRAPVRTPTLTEMPEKAVLRHNHTRITGAMLTRALLEKARQELPGHVKRLSQATGIGFTEVSVRNQQSRWGSCSSTGSINLNWRLIKCAPAARDYVIIHELAHTRVFNHSPAFWDLVHRLMPDYRQALAWISENGSLVFAPELDVPTGP